MPEREVASSYSDILTYGLADTHPSELAGKVDAPQRE
jgi:hypothetical protein